MAIKRYSEKEPLVFIWIAIPYMVGMNLLIFGKHVFSSWATFGLTFLISTIYFFLVYGLFGTVAVKIKNTWPNPGDLFKRISIMLPVFYFMNAPAIGGLFYLYDYTGWVECITRHNMIKWTILYGCVMSTVITFINEGMANWEKWKKSLSQSEKLRNAFHRSKLLGLKGQINPHFLFNCFNTLSGLIHEDPERADDFLNEMIRVHRYLLRSDDAHLVSVADEVKYANSYLSLARARFGDAISADLKIQPAAMNNMIPPLTMQVILENIIYTNALNKKDPVNINISSEGDNTLTIAHSIHEKVIVRNLNTDEGIDNLITRYGLLTAEVEITEQNAIRKFTLPLFTGKEQVQ